MGTWVVVGTILFMIWIVSLFGGKMSPERSIKWWFFLGFLLAATISPDSLVGITQALGINLVSNFVFAVISLFLVFQIVELSVLLTKSQIEQRSLVTSLASQIFTKKSQASRNLIVLPCFNEEKSLPLLIGRLKKLCLNFPEFSFCFVDDGSRDQSLQILKELCDENYVSHITNQGVSGALLSGFKIAKSSGFEYVIQCDADGQHPIELIPLLLNQAKKLESDLHVGSRFLPDQTNSVSGIESTTILRRIGSLSIVRGLYILFGVKVSDPTSGFRVYSRNLMERLIYNMPEKYPEPETIALCWLWRLKVSEMGVMMFEREHGRSSLNGLASLKFMAKVTSALIGLRIHSWLRPT